MIQLYLVRHGMTDLNMHHAYQGWIDPPLNEAGYGQAKQVQKKLEGVRWDQVITSPLQRAIRTAELITGMDREAMTLAPDLREMHFGQWEGKTHQEIALQFPEQWEAWCRDWTGYGIPGGESYLSFYERVKVYFARLCQSDDDRTILLVCHDGVLKVLATLILELPAEACWKFTFEFGCYSRFHLKRENMVVLKLNA